MKSIFNTLLSGLAAFSLFSTSALALVTQNGDMYACFYEFDGIDTVGPNTYYFRLGPASVYRENTLSNVLISNVAGSTVSNSNINVDLTAAFGTNWASSGMVRWCIVGGNQQNTTGLLGGELQGSSYVSRARSNFNTQSVQPTGINGSLRNVLRLNISSIRSYHNNLISMLASGALEAQNSNGTFTPRSLSDTTPSCNIVLPPFTTTQFGITQNVLQTFEAGLIPGSTDLEGALDVWRLVNAEAAGPLTATQVLNETSGTDRTSGFGTGLAVLGTGQYCGAITLDSSGNLKVVGPPAVSTANFASWADTNNVTGGPNGDFDNDGIRNLAEYALNLNPAGSDGAAGTFTNGLLSFAKRAVAVTNGDVGYAIEESVNLSVWTPAPASAITNSNTVITYALAPGSPKKFARLKLTTTP